MTFSSSFWNSKIECLLKGCAASQTIRTIEGSRSGRTSSTPFNKLPPLKLFRASGQYRFSFTQTSFLPHLIHILFLSSALFFLSSNSFFTLYLPLSLPPPSFYYYTFFPTYTPISCSIYTQLSCYIHKSKNKKKETQYQFNRVSYLDQTTLWYSVHYG